MKTKTIAQDRIDFGKTKQTLFFIIMMIFVSCTNNSQNEIQVFGTLSDIMHKGAREGVVVISEAISEDHIYGLGAMENLDGEIIIMDSRPFITRAQPGKSPTNQTELTSETKALLLVSTKVTQWNSVTLNSETDYNSIETMIKAEAKKIGINPDNPFPFLIEGDFDQLNWHIISPQGTDGSHDHHLTNSWKKEESNVNGKILGFYSERHQTIFTHHSRYSHMHIIFESESLSGHVDDLVITKPWKLSFPKFPN